MPFWSAELWKGVKWDEAASFKSFLCADCVISPIGKATLTCNDCKFVWWRECPPHAVGVNRPVLVSSSDMGSYLDRWWVGKAPFTKTKKKFEVVPPALVLVPRHWSQVDLQYTRSRSWFLTYILWNSACFFFENVTKSACSHSTLQPYQKEIHKTE